MSDVLARPGTRVVAGEVEMQDAKGHWVPEALVKASDKLQDEVARDLFTRAKALQATLAAFKLSAFSDVDAFLEILDRQYGAKIGGAKGNLTLASYDGKIRVIVAVQDQFSYGPELQTAKALVDECVGEWSAGARVELKALVSQAFNHDQEGRVNRSALLSLKNLDIQDPRWVRAMQAIKDAESVEDTKRYIRFSWRPNKDAKWSSIELNIASA